MYKVLIVDDSIQDINGLINHIDWKKYNCQVIGKALNGLEGVEKARELLPDIIVTDISMPVIDGIELTKRVSKVLPDVKFIYISCFDDPEFLKSALDNDVTAYIYKPIDIGLFNDALEKVTLKIKEKNDIEKLNTTLKEQISLNRQYLIEQYIKDIISTGVVNASRAELLDFSVDKSYYFILIQFDDEASVLHENTYSYYLQLINLIREVFSADYVVSYDWSKVFVMIPENKEISDVVDALNNLQTEFEEQFSYTFSAFITSGTHGINELNKIFGSFNSIITQQYFAAKNQIVLLEDEFEMISYKQNIDVSLIVENLKDYILNNDIDAVKLLIDEYIDENTVYNMSYIKSLCFHCISTINIMLIEQNENFSNIFGDELLIWQKLANLNSNINIKQWLYNIIDVTMKYLNDRTKEDKYIYIAGEVKKYIDQNYSSSTLSDEISNEFSISFDYANRIFKRRYQKTITQYSTDKKINRAKELLATTNKKVLSIAEEVGYSSNLYFSIAFKKNTGVSPSEYRSANLKITE